MNLEDWLVLRASGPKKNKPHHVLSVGSHPHRSGEDGEEGEEGGEEGGEEKGEEDEEEGGGGTGGGGGKMASTMKEIWWEAREWAERATWPGVPTISRRWPGS